MKDFGIWYLNYGWIITTVIALPVGAYAAHKSSVKIVVAFIVLTLVVGCIAAYGKHA